MLWPILQLMFNYINCTPALPPNTIGWWYYLVDVLIADNICLEGLNKLTMIYKTKKKPIFIDPKITLISVIPWFN